MTDEPLLMEDRGEVRWITLNRPATHNAQSPEMLRALERALTETRDDRTVRAVVLSAAGKSFSSGHDLKAAVEDPDYRHNLETVEGRLWQELSLFVRPVEMLRELPMPTICRLQGHCIAAALMLVAATDLVIAADDTTIRSQVTRDQGVDDVELPTVSWALGDRRAKQFLWMSEVLDAEQAVDLGLVNWVVPRDELDAKTDEVLDELLKVPREALALSKLSFRFIEERRGRSDVADYHFLTHQLAHNTSEARELLARRQRGD